MQRVMLMQLVERGVLEILVELEQMEQQVLREELVEREVQEALVEKRVLVVWLDGVVLQPEVLIFSTHIQQVFMLLQLEGWEEMVEVLEHQALEVLAL
jgi:hypothetical protein